MKLSLIWAMAENRVIGINNSLPWHLSEDLKYFKRTTMGKCIIMGRKTYESIGMLLPGRTNIIVSRDVSYAVEGAKVANSLERALEIAEGVCFIDGSDEAFVIGGAGIYESALPFADRLHMTRVHAVVTGDTYFGEFDMDKWELVGREDYSAGERDTYDYSICVYERRED